MEQRYRNTTVRPSKLVSRINRTWLYVVAIQGRRTTAEKLLFKNINLEEIMPSRIGEPLSGKVVVKLVTPLSASVTKLITTIFHVCNAIKIV